jgi:predicted RNA binding protein YcfA (HicA-like mRNA interferase family)
MKYSELKRILKQNGCYKTSEGSNHEEWFSPITNNSFPIGRHRDKDVPIGTHNAILKQSGIKR